MFVGQVAVVVPAFAFHGVAGTNAENLAGYGIEVVFVKSGVEVHAVLAVVEIFAVNFHGVAIFDGKFLAYAEVETFVGGAFVIAVASYRIAEEVVGLFMHAADTQAAFDIQAVGFHPLAQKAAAGIIHGAVAALGVVAMGGEIAPAMFDEYAVFRGGFFLDVLAAEGHNAIPHVDVDMAAGFLTHSAAANLGKYGYAVLADVFFAGQAFSCRQDKVIAGVKGNCCSLGGHNGVMRLAAYACAFHLIDHIAISVKDELAGTFRGRADGKFRTSIHIGSSLICCDIALVQKRHGGAGVQGFNAGKGYLFCRNGCTGQIRGSTIADGEGRAGGIPRQSRIVQRFNAGDILNRLAATGPWFVTVANVQRVAGCAVVAADDVAIRYICAAVEGNGVVNRAATAAAKAAVNVTAYFAIADVDAIAGGVASCAVAAVDIAVDVDAAGKVDFVGIGIAITIALAAVDTAAYTAARYGSFFADALPDWL